MSKNENLISNSALTGELFVPMTNDYLFRAMLQRNERILKGLIGSLLSLQQDEISSVVIANPIELGEKIDDKTFILDILVVLNNSNVLNLEMQVIKVAHWINRSLCYICRTFDSLHKGDDYNQVMPVHQIGILDFTLFEDEPEFYADYMLLNTRTHRLYSDKIKLSMLDLTRIDLATEEDKANELVYWAELFKATTWEELRMLAEKEPIFEEVATEVVKISKEDKIRMQCEAREDYYRSQRSVHGYYEEKIAEKDAEIEQLKAELAKLKQEK